ncbi:hypothetical protein GCM10010507_03410 [Streptomyces cinnamoneus]|uniref:RDD domain-containing protein n=1 Tax=Streptomyces cinnamoneus TaxID=53446 RepID=A0A918WDT9_STRCJ|nr:hypothetical protein GCM10010507_03410 [Streptomyces cinnamoneus]
MIGGISYWIGCVSYYQQQPGGPQPGGPAPYGYPAPPPQYYQPGMPPMGGPSGPPEQALANQGARLGARLLDVLFIILAVLALSLIGALLGQAGGAAAGVGLAIDIIGMAGVFLFYEPYMVSQHGGTFGKRICGLRVARLSDGQNLSFGAAFGRWAVYLLIGFVPLAGPINALSCCWDKPYRQCFHDKAVSSVVVNRT